MNKVAQQFGNSLQSFVRDEEGAQIIEYALIVAVVSLVLIIAIKTALVDNGGAFTSWLDKVKACLTAAATGCS
ncbi:Flp family type IVb pilin [Comamonas terrae]|uniref:Flp family type IVb pilin n=1 Tax=Comamonas terrae TaxID=673548 RepID=A0ABW5UIV7_9BURK|nr:Flp family type IVb pilin [Comamonas terrae]